MMNTVAKFHHRRPVNVLGSNGTLACIEYADEEGGHEHVPLDHLDDCRYPEVKVEITGEDGNIGNIMGLVSRALRHAGYSQQVINEYRRGVFGSESYDAALQLTMRWVDVQ